MKRHTNRLLLITLLILVAAFVLTRVFRSPARESNLNTELFAIDTAQIARITLQRPGAAVLTLEKNDSSWTVKEQEQTATVETYAVNNLLRTLAATRPERLVTDNEEKWNTYQVDTAAIHLVAYARDNGELINWHVGKESQGATYVRPDDEAPVYALSGSVRNRIDKDFNEWRDKTFLRVKTPAITKITFTYPADSGFVLKKSDSKWMLDDALADSVQVQQYINKLRSRDLSNFAENFSASSNPDVSVTIEEDNGLVTVVKGWKDLEDGWTLTSTLQPEVYFRDDATAHDLFVGKNELAGGK